MPDRDAGGPASGKSTLARALAALTGGVVVSSDDHWIDPPDLHERPWKWEDPGCYDLVALAGIALPSPTVRRRRSSAAARTPPKPVTVSVNR